MNLLEKIIQKLFQILIQNICITNWYSANQPVRYENSPLVLDLFCVCPPSTPHVPNYQTRVIAL